MFFWRRLLDRITRRSDRDLDREIRAHIDLEAEDRQDAGLTLHQAHHAAQRAFGNVTLVKEATREMWGFMWLDRLATDLRHGCRTLKNNPGFTAVAILTAALGIGANTAIFSVVHAVLLRPLPYKHAERLVSPVNVAKDNFIGLGVGDFQYATWREQASIFDGIAAYSGRRLIESCLTRGSSTTCLPPPGPPGRDATMWVSDWR